MEATDIRLRTLNADEATRYAPTIAAPTIAAPTQQSTAIGDHVSDIAVLHARRDAAEQLRKEARAAMPKQPRRAATSSKRLIDRYAAPERFYSVENMPELANLPNARAELIAASRADRRAYVAANDARKLGSPYHASLLKTFNDLRSDHKMLCSRYSVPIAGY